MFDTDVYLVGASGGVYALLAAHLANVLLVRLFLNLLIYFKKFLFISCIDIYRYFIVSFSVELQ